MLPPMMWIWCVMIGPWHWSPKSARIVPCSFSALASSYGMRNNSLGISDIIRTRAKMFCVVVFALIVSLGADALAQDGWRQNGKPVGDDRSRASSPNGFAIMQIATLDPAGFAARWNQPGAGVDIAKTSSVIRKQPVMTFIIFTGCAPDPSGNCNVTADFKMFDPDGHSFGEQLGSQVWVGMPPPPKYQLQLSSNALGMVVQDEDRLGNYRIVATVIDHISGTTLTTEQTILAKPAG